MNYLYCDDANFEDFASGRVLYGGNGIPNFPVRLLNEIFGRAVARCAKKEHLTVYDPCCGGGYSLTVLGFCHSAAIDRLYGSDIDPRMAAHACKNAALLTRAGMAARRAEIERMIEMYDKPSHYDALKSAYALESMLSNDIPMEIFEADCTRPLPGIAPDVIIADIPYGNLVGWGGDADSPLTAMLARLAEISSAGTILALCMDKKQKLATDRWVRIEKQNIGKRRFEILRKA